MAVVVPASDTWQCLRRWAASARRRVRTGTGTAAPAATCCSAASAGCASALRATATPRGILKDKTNVCWVHMREVPYYRTKNHLNN